MDASKQEDIPFYDDAQSIMNSVPEREYTTGEERLMYTLMNNALEDLGNVIKRPTDTVMERVEKMEMILTANDYLGSDTFGEISEMLDLDPNFQSKLKKMLNSENHFNKLNDTWNSYNYLKDATGNFTRLSEVQYENADEFIVSGKRLRPQGKIFSSSSQEENSFEIIDLPMPSQLKTAKFKM